MKLLQYRYVGEHNLELYNNYLNNYGLSMDIRLTDNQIGFLQNENQSNTLKK